MIFTFHISLKVDEFSLGFFSKLFQKDTTIRHKSMKAEGQTASFFQMMHNCKYAIGLMGTPTKKERLFLIQQMQFDLTMQFIVAYGLQQREKDRSKLFSSSSLHCALFSIFYHQTNCGWQNYLCGLMKTRNMQTHCCLIS